MSSSVLDSNGYTVAILAGVLVGGVVGAGVTAALMNQQKKKDEDDNNNNNNNSINNNNNNNKSRVLLDAVAQEQLLLLTKNVTNFDDVTHVNFLSDLITRLWPYINEAGSATIRETVEPMFADMMPGPMKSLKFTKIDLGSVPMVIDNIIVHELTQGCVKFDWDISWQSSSDIQLAANYGIQFGVKSIKLQGRMSFLLKPLSNALPCIDAVQYSFVNPPTLELNFTGLANIADFSVIDKTIRKIMQDVLASMMVLPVRMMYKMTPNTNLWEIHTPLTGVARVSLLRGRGFQVEKRTLRSDDVPDVYCVMTLGAGNGYGPDEWKSSTVRNNLNPDWTLDHKNDNQKKKKECKDFLLSDLDQILTIEAWDEDKGPADPDDFLGSCQVAVGQILLAGKMMELELVLKEKKGSFRGTGCFVTIAVDVMLFTTEDHSSLLDEKNKKQEESSTGVINPENQLAGLLTVLITKAFNIPVPKKDAASFVKVLYGDKEIGVTGVVTDLPGYDAINPTYEITLHFPLKPVDTSEHKQLQEIKLQLMNNKTLLGEIVIEPEHLLRANRATIQDKRNIGTEGASLEFYISLAGVKNDSDGLVASTAAAHNTTTTTTVRSVGDDDALPVSHPSNITTTTTTTTSNITRTSLVAEKIRVVVVKGHGFKVKKTRRFKKDDSPDVYCVVKFGSNPQTWRTKTVKDNVEPEWNESSDYSMSSPNQVISIDVFDENRRSTDDLYGNARVAFGKVLLSGGAMDVEVMLEGQKTGLFVTVSCTKL
jgi:hypothetical protein